MKALKSELAKRVLAEPRAREQLREIAAGEFRAREGRANGVIVLHDSKGHVHRRLTATVVPKAV